MNRLSRSRPDPRAGIVPPVPPIVAALCCLAAAEPAGGQAPCGVDDIEAVAEAVSQALAQTPETPEGPAHLSPDAADPAWWIEEIAGAIGCSMPGDDDAILSWIDDRLFFETGPPGTAGAGSPARDGPSPWGFLLPAVDLRLRVRDDYGRATRGSSRGAGAVFEFWIVWTASPRWP